MSETTKPTPGPWRAILNRDRNKPQPLYRGIVCELEHSTEQRTCVIADAEWDCSDRDRIDANARLIAAAPELLAACQAWADYFDELDAAGCDPNDPLTTERRKFHGKRIAATRAALAKATGATP